MSSFFTVPASQRKRKRDDRNTAPTTKKRGVDAKNDAGSRRAQEREESISGSDLDEDENGIVSAGSGEDSESDSDDGETAGDRRLKLAERYLDNVREEVDEVGFDAAEIDRDLIAERLKEDVVRRYPHELFMRSVNTKSNYRTNSRVVHFAESLPNYPSPMQRILSSAQIPRPVLLLPFTRPSSTLLAKIRLSRSGNWQLLMTPMLLHPMKTPKDLLVPSAKSQSA